MLRMGRRVLQGETRPTWDDGGPTDAELAHSLAERADWLGGVLVRRNAPEELVDEAASLLDYFRTRAELRTN